MPITLDAEPKKIPKGNSTAVIKEQKVEKKETTCICKEQYKDLVWGGKVSGDFRKKVVEISQALWPHNYMEMANGLMAVMKVETSGSFKAQQLEGWRSYKDPEEMTIQDFRKDGNRKSSRAVGLIQFTQDALQNNLKEYVSNLSLTIEERFDELNKLKLSYAQMGEIRQLDKVKKYFESQKNSIKSPEDIYLAVFAPSGVGKANDFILYEKFDNPSTDKEKTSTKNYNANKSVDTRSTGKHKSDNKIQRSEILERFHESINEGKNNRANTYSCGAVQSSESVNAKDIVTFHIYADGKIEKHIPKVIKEEYKQKYKYVYHDSQNGVHEICIANWVITSKKLPSKSKLYSKPTHSKIISDKNVTEGQTSRRVIYDNGDIAEYGSNDGDTFWRLYSSTSEKIELVEMPESVKYVKYSFSGTQRRYTGPNYFAGFLGALARSGLSVVTTGSCFREGSCFPSQFHVNGESVDTTYFWDLKKDQLFVDSMRFFHYGEIKVGAFKGKHGAYFSSLKNVSDGKRLHNSHFHSGEFDSSKIKIIKE